jgi:hypothetical protein
MIAAICCLSGFFLLAPLSLCAGVATAKPTLDKPPLTVLMDFDSPHSETPIPSLRRSLSRLLTYGDISVDLEMKEDLPAKPQFGQLVIFKMKGSCSMNPVASDLRRSPSGPLAMAYTSDGQVLHFGEVECDRVRLALEKILGFGGSRRNQETYGAALAIVIAHEVYHMLGNATRHTRDGLTKAALSAAELASPKLAYSADAAARLKHP